MESNEVSVHEVSVYQALKSAGRWMTNKEIHEAIDNIAQRTVRSHTLKLVKLGLVDQAEVFPGHRYKWSDKSEKRNLTYVNRLDNASEVFASSPRRD